MLPEHLLCAHHEVRSEQVGDMRLVLSLVGLRIALGTWYMLRFEA